MLRTGRAVVTVLILAVLLAVALPANARAQPATDLAAINMQIAQLHEQGRYAEATAAAEKALALAERTLGADNPQTLFNIATLAMLYQTLGRYAEAEPLYKRSLQTCERVLGPEHPQTLASVQALATLFQVQGRYAEAEPLYKRSLETFERILGKDHPQTLSAAIGLALIYQAESRFSEAEPLYLRAFQGFERSLGKDHPFTLVSLVGLAGIYEAQRRFAEAQPLYLRALEMSERTLGPEHHKTVITVNNLARLYLAQGRYGEAEPLLERALDAQTRMLGPDHPSVAVTLDNLAALYFAQSDWPRATEFWRRGTGAIVQHAQRGAPDAGQSPTGRQKSEAEQSNWQFRNLVKAASRLAPEGRAPDAAVSRETFQTAQWALGSEAAQSLAQMAARGAAGDPGLSALVRERQDLVVEWQKRDGSRSAALGQPLGARDAEAENANIVRLAAIDTRIAAIDKRLAAEFPDYASLASPAPLAVDEVQAQLGADEALVLFLDTPEYAQTPEETFIWVVTKTGMRWVRSDLGTATLTAEVQALRCGLDGENWIDPADWPEATEHAKAEKAEQAARRNRCIGLARVRQVGAKALPFDHTRAHKLYTALFGQVEDIIKGKHLLLVPSGALTQLPFQVLVTAPPATGDRKSLAWLIRDHALTVLPAVSSLKALRRVARPSAATKPMIGFGNPLLDGPDSRYAKYARLARDNQRCGDTPMQQVAAFFGLRGTVTPVATRGGLAKIAHIRMQVPLPETAGELCGVARDLHADLGEMRLGSRATEREVKDLSANGQLAQYRIVHFATHGTLAGQLNGTSEPGLIMTPPADATAEDDGYLSASEIAALKLDADWVVLSACNTAAGDAKDAQALSGLARAFIYAQTRALLVSHWAVDSDAAVKLVTKAMGEMVRDHSTGRAEALRRAMLALIDSGNAREAHPAFWAPFVVVGEGARQ